MRQPSLPGGEEHVMVLGVALGDTRCQSTSSGSYKQQRTAYKQQCT